MAHLLCVLALSDLQVCWQLEMFSVHIVQRLVDLQEPAVFGLAVVAGQGSPWDARSVQHF